jgi:hypothetical protein
LLVVHDALSDLGPGVFAGFEEAGVDEALAQGFVFEQAAFREGNLYNYAGGRGLAFFVKKRVDRSYNSLFRCRDAIPMFV